MAYEALLNTTCSVERQMGVYDPAVSEFGEVREDWVVVAFKVMCRLDRGGTPMQLRRSGLVEMGYKMLYVLKDADIRENDRVRVADQLFYVSDITNIEGYSDLHHKEIHLSLIDGRDAK